MSLKRQLFYALSALILALISQEILAEVANADNAMSSLYSNLLQREYAGPVVFPNHQVERKAQRSPSLRLRFGRRSDPDVLLPSAEKRWFGDVHQKPIRSPSLRLRFGRRSDPAMPLHSNFDALMNDLTMQEEQNEQDYNDAVDEVYEQRVVRKPQRLRWGRSVPFEGTDNDFAEVENARDQQRQRADEFFNSLLNSEKLRSMLLSLRPYEIENAAAAAAAAAANEDDEANDEFQREVRKPAPLRLRWGRSTGGAAVTANEVQEKKSVAQNAVTTNAAQQVGVEKH